MKITNRQKAVLEMIIEGVKYETIAGRIGVGGKSAVSSVLNTARRRNNVGSTPELVAMAFRNGVLK